MHALGPALVICVLAGGNAVEAAPFVLLLAFAAQLAFDCASSSLHDLLVFGTRPRLHARVLLQVWGVDAALAPIGLLVAETSQSLGWAVLAPLPLVALLSAMSADRSRRIGQAHERLGALNRERRRREEAVQRVGDALASNLELREAESRLRHQAFHDGLTGLPNRTLFAERVTRATTRARATPQPLAVAFLDLDGFKLVNDTLGHEAGDELLVTVADRITGCLRPGDTAARLGGDEFAVLLEDLQVPGEAEAVAERVRVALRRPVMVRDRQFVVRASVGFAFQTAEESADTLLRQADLAMYAAKKEGGDCARQFEPDMLTAATRECCERRGPDVGLAVLAGVDHRPDGEIDGAVVFTEPGAAFA
jgi:diguanylate cyclase (GGDEF)-like protein